jgi:hypothetical protein
MRTGLGFRRPPVHDTFFACVNHNVHIHHVDYPSNNDHDRHTDFDNTPRFPATMGRADAWW